MSAAFFKVPDIDWDFLLAIAAWLAARTEIKSDDEFVEFLKIAKEEAELAGFIKARVADEEAGVLKVVDAPEGAVIGEDLPLSLVETVERRGIFKGAKDRAERIAKMQKAIGWAIELYKLYKTFAG